MNLTDSNVTFGNTYCDDVTSFTGVATAHCRYHQGESSVRLERLSNDGNSVQAEWFPVGRLSFATSA